MSFTNLDERTPTGPTYAKFPHRVDRSLKSIPYRDSYTQLPVALRTKMWYTDHGVLNPIDASGGFVKWPFGANRPRDPYTPTGGHSPKGWNTFASWYAVYAPYHTDIQCEFRNQTLYADDSGEVSSMDVLVGITLTNNQFEMPLNIQTLMEDPFTKTALLTRAGERASLRMNWDVKAFWPMDTYSDIVDIDGFIRIVSQDPEYAYTFYVWATPYYGSGMGTISCTVNLSYNVLFFQPNAAFIGDDNTTGDPRPGYTPLDDSMLAGSTGELTFNDQEPVETSPGWILDT